MSEKRKDGIRYLVGKSLSEQLAAGLAPDARNTKHAHQKVFDRYMDRMINQEHEIEGKGGKKEYEAGYEPIDTPRTKIYTMKSKKTYEAQSMDFCKWLGKTERPTRFHDLAEAEQFLVPYVEDLGRRVERGDLRPATARDYRQALTKVFRLPPDKTERGSEYFPKLPEVSQYDKVRSRLEVAQDRHFSREKHDRVVEFQEAFGLRRGDLEHMKGQQHYYDEKGRLCLNIYKGKGGKDRVVHCMARTPEALKRIEEELRSADPKKPMWGKQSAAWDIHGDRRGTAVWRYKELERPWDQIPQNEKLYLERRNPLTGKMERRVFDLRAVMMISYDWGHNRCDVTGYDYLDGVEGYPDDGGSNPSALGSKWNPWND
jgi:hypothetical protein